MEGVFYCFDLIMYVNRLFHVIELLTMMVFWEIKSGIGLITNNKKYR